jgi:hypothetical protein
LFAVPLAIVFALATLSGGQTENSSAKDKSEQADESSSKNRSERVCLLLSIYVPLLCVIDDKTHYAIQPQAVGRGLLRAAVQFQ